jgi:DNA (cytosine-5)-methyltransferase 1
MLIMLVSLQLLKKMAKSEALTYLSLFSSAGVGCYGFKLEGFLCVATVELLEKRMKYQQRVHI